MANRRQRGDEVGIVSTKPAQGTPEMNAAVFTHATLLHTASGSIGVDASIAACQVLNTPGLERLRCTPAQKVTRNRMPQSVSALWCA